MAGWADVFQSLIAADPWHKTRFHDMHGHYIGTSALLRDLPRTLVGAVARELLGYYPPQPWIPYPAIRALARVARPTWRVLESGAGMSTVWWAQRVQSVHAIEANREWYERVRRQLAQRGLSRASVEWRPLATYSDLSMFTDASFDLVVIDGHDRQIIAEQALRVGRRPGYIYLDNSDYAVQWHDMYGEAVDILEQAAHREGGCLTAFTGLQPATLKAGEGILLAR